MITQTLSFGTSTKFTVDLPANHILVIEEETIKVTYKTATGKTTSYSKTQAPGLTFDTVSAGVPGVGSNATAGKVNRSDDPDYWVYYTGYNDSTSIKLNITATLNSDNKLLPHSGSRVHPGFDKDGSYTALNGKIRLHFLKRDELPSNWTGINWLIDGDGDGTYDGPEVMWSFLDKVGLERKDEDQVWMVENTPLQLTGNMSVSRNKWAGQAQKAVVFGEKSQISSNGVIEKLKEGTKELGFFAIDGFGRGLDWALRNETLSSMTKTLADSIAAGVNRTPFPWLAQKMIDFWKEEVKDYRDFPSEYAKLIRQQGNTLQDIVGDPPPPATRPGEVKAYLRKLDKLQGGKQAKDLLQLLDKAEAQAKNAGTFGVRGAVPDRFSDGFTAQELKTGFADARASIAGAVMFAQIADSGLKTGLLSALEFRGFTKLGGPKVTALGSVAGDRIKIGAKVSAVATGAGDDEVRGGNGQDAISGGTGNDLLGGGNGNDTVLGGSGRDVIDGGGGNDRLEGGTDSDRIKGGSGADRLSGGAGRDKLLGGGQNDTLFGGTENDTLKGEGGNDRLLGQSGNDRLEGGDGNDRLDGGGGNDALLGQSGNDTLLGNNGNDVLRGGAGNDVLRGHGGNDRLLGEDGDDRLEGGSGKDVLLGGNGDDYLLGGVGADQLLGGFGADEIVLQFDGDTANPGAGGDVMRVIAGGTATEIKLTGTMQAGDRLDLSPLELDVIHRDGAAFTGDGRGAARLFGREVQIDTDGDGTTDKEILFDSAADLAATRVDVLPGGAAFEALLSGKTMVNDHVPYIVGTQGDDYIKVILDDDTRTTLRPYRYADEIEGGFGDDLIDIGKLTFFTQSNMVVAPGEGNDHIVFRPGYAWRDDALIPDMGLLVTRERDLQIHFTAEGAGVPDNADHIVLFADDWGGLSFDDLVITQRDPRFTPTSVWSVTVNGENRSETFFLSTSGVTPTADDFLIL